MHFAIKAELFGKEKVARDISQDDLDKKDLECLLCGYQQVLPVRDRAGRGVFLFLPYLKSNLGIKHKVRFSICLPSEPVCILMLMLSVAFFVLFNYGTPGG